LVHANSNTGLLNREVFYLGHAMGEIEGATPYRVSTVDVGLTRAVVGNTIVSINDPRDIDKDRRVTTIDVGFLRARVGNTVLLDDITIPAASSVGEGQQGAAGSIPGPMTSALGSDGDASKSKIQSMPNDALSIPWVDEVFTELGKKRSRRFS
jgi:hypothetical protein